MFLFCMLSSEDVIKLAKLSRLHISEEEIANYQIELGSILEYVDQLKEYDLSEIPELQHATSKENVFREDVTACDPETRARALRLFFNQQDELLEVQGVFEKKFE